MFSMQLLPEKVINIIQKGKDNGFSAITGRNNHCIIWYSQKLVSADDITQSVETLTV